MPKSEGGRPNQERALYTLRRSIRGVEADVCDMLEGSPDMNKIAELIALRKKWKAHLDAEHDKLMQWASSMTAQGEDALTADEERKDPPQTANQQAGNPSKRRDLT